LCVIVLHLFGVRDRSLSGARALQHDLNAAVLRAAWGRVVRRVRMGLAEHLVRDDVSA